MHGLHSIPIGIRILALMESRRESSTDVIWSVEDLRAAGMRYGLTNVAKSTLQAALWKLTRDGTIEKIYRSANRVAYRLPQEKKG